MSKPTQSAAPHTRGARCRRTATVNNLTTDPTGARPQLVPFLGIYDQGENSLEGSHGTWDLEVLAAPKPG